MSDPFLGEIRLFGFGSVPKGWHACDGSLLGTRENQALYSLLGTTYGGDGKSTFALPDLRGRVPVGANERGGGGPYGRGKAGGAEAVALSAAEMPKHAHELRAAATAGTKTGVPGSIYAKIEKPTEQKIYGAMSRPPVAVEPSTLAPAGGGLAHDNMQPFMTLNYCIATIGTYPPRP